ncbi:hypothetical protein FA13DRAFT_1718859 [Coprinellus micaceus]|uniref:Uncharacterized protein n=1 Tax=Coprinellus micaceus TaxID=71717 RepID=A0A4Y7SCM1_COPMI|nr:hypothetical protein FA13DRAFT_1718859 [Coprinellus micaceus]
MQGCSVRMVKFFEGNRHTHLRDRIGDAKAMRNPGTSINPIHASRGAGLRNKWICALLGGLLHTTIACGISCSPLLLGREPTTNVRSPPISYQPGPIPGACLTIWKEVRRVYSRAKCIVDLPVLWIPIAYSDSEANDLGCLARARACAAISTNLL